ncbi:MAG: hypothetical protein ACRC46_06515, partial [Thermoguttaceae bacterium]
QIRDCEHNLAAREDLVCLTQQQCEQDAKKYAQLKELERSVAGAQAEVTRIREGLVRERHQLQKSIETERQRLRESHEMTVRHIEQERRDLAVHNKKLEQMRLAIDRSRDELGRMHRETLEVRLATEELWVRLAGDSAPDQLKEALARTRSRLADQYQDGLAKIEREKNELATTRDQIVQQHERLLARREELETWAAKSEDVLIQRDEQLKLREKEIDQRQFTVDNLVRSCRQERDETERELTLLKQQIATQFKNRVKPAA